MANMHRKDYQAVARMLRGLTVCNGREHEPMNVEPHVTLCDLMQGLANVFEAGNPAFDRDRFFFAVYGEREE